MASKGMPIGDGDESFQQPWRRSLGQDSESQQIFLIRPSEKSSFFYPYRLSIRLYNNQVRLSAEVLRQINNRKSVALEEVSSWLLGGGNLLIFGAPLSRGFIFFTDFDGWVLEVGWKVEFWTFFFDLGKWNRYIGFFF